MDNKPNNFFPEKETWGTCEELLLACAVHRYGAENWNSVAREVQKRSSTLQRQLLTPFSCQQKYDDLRRRFSHGQLQNYAEDHAPLLDVLKRLRVDELKREVERYDLSILSLQLKVKRLTEEREQSLTESRKNETGISDLERTGEDDSKPLTDKPVTGEESDRENRSVNESNFTDPRAEDADKQPVEPASDEPVENKPAGEDSSNGSCGSAAKEPARNSGELVESVAESKGGEEDRSSKKRESGSDVQSSSTASLSREEAEKGEKPDEPDNDEEEEEEDQAPANKRGCVESQPLIDFLEILRSYKLGSIFERLDNQQGKSQYRSLIRQHIDLETIQMKLQANRYSGCNNSFFRDLLLLFNNAILFFSNKSSESIAAIELRQVVLKEMALKLSNPKLLLKEQQSLVFPTPKNLKSDLESSDSLPIKPNISAPLIACRKRSSLKSKGSVSDKKREQTSTLIDKKPDLDWKQPDKSSVKADPEHQATTKKRTRERPLSGTRNNSSKNSRTENNSKPKNVVDYSSEEEVTDNKKSEAKVEKERKNKVNVKAKKQSASNFSSRTKRSSPSKNGPLLETLKSSVIASDKGPEKNKKSSSKSDSRKEQIPRKNSAGGKRGKEMESPPKRNLGRQKRAPAATSPPQASGKRSNRKEGGESASRRARKRSRK